jgi:signal transduction histidine kinase/CheY-like chemotaxis protein
MPDHSENANLEALLRQARYLEVIHEFALSQVGLNSLDDIVWNVARTAIAKLGFVDCVIYLTDDSGTMLVQRAAHGPKNPVAQDILDPITIPVGQGIVGSVVASGQVELIPDTRLDKRYIVDDAMRLSELAVPIIHQDKVIGVLDSEHPEPGFFTDDHVQLLTTIASLASTRIDTALAMERLEATVERLQETEQRLASRAEELREAKLLADQASSEKSRFLANMSHEIKTPMTAIVGYADLLTRPDKSAEQRDEWAEQVRRSADHLLGLVDDVLDLSKIESGQFSPDIRMCDFDALVADVCSMMRLLAQERGLEFKVHLDGPLPLQFETDSLRLRQMLVNLLSNAAKYTDQGRVELFLHTRVDEKQHLLEVVIAVEDSGIGIEPGAMEAIFEPFIQAERDSHRRGGTGLGLSISRSFARMLGGDISVESAPGRGSRFTLRIPCGPIDRVICVSADRFDLDHRRRRSSRRPGPSLDGKAVQVVEDSSAIAGLLRHLLVEAGAEVRHAENGEMGVGAVLDAIGSGAAPDLIIMDMLMPVMDGYSAARELRNRGVRIPIVALTAFTLADDHEKCLAAGCDAYLSKPIDPARFVSQIASCMEQ